MPPQQQQQRWNNPPVGQPQPPPQPQPPQQMNYSAAPSPAPYQVQQQQMVAHHPPQGPAGPSTPIISSPQDGGANGQVVGVVGGDQMSFMIKNQQQGGAMQFQHDPNMSHMVPMGSEIPQHLVGNGNEMMDQMKNSPMQTMQQQQQLQQQQRHHEDHGGNVASANPTMGEINYTFGENLF
jgi:hypothetical protein